jgi:MoxR-like ATPase
MVLATQNPIELEGTYPLPEAQLDRFFFKLVVTPPSPDELREILKRTTGIESDDAEKVFPEDNGLVNEMKQLLRQVMIAPPIEDYVVRLVHATQADGQNGGPSKASIKQYIRFGASPRGAQSVILGAKGNALVEGRVHVSYADIETIIFPALRHRLILNFQAEAENVTTDQLIAEVMKQVPRN